MATEPDNFERDPRQWQTGHDPMTDAQRILLESLSNQAGEPSPDERLTKAEASELIERLRRDVGEYNDEDDTDTVLGDDE
ncbi:MAG: DUF3072 domain-containing protein [Candidatus Saccharimonadales bacterium]